MSDRNGKLVRSKAPASDNDNDPFRLARVILDGFGETEGETHLRRWAEEWLLWTEGSYKALPDKEWDARASEEINRQLHEANRRRARPSGKKENKALFFSGRLLSDVRLAAQSQAQLAGRIVPPSWLSPRRHDAAPADLLPCKNALVNLQAMANGDEYLMDPTPRFFCRHSLDYDFQADAPDPTAWLKFLDELWPEDKESIKTLQEWAGYLLTADTAQQKILLVIGPKRSGKGTIARVLRKLVGNTNCCGPTLSGLSSGFGLQPLVGKTVAIVSDARLSNRTDQAIVVERLLAISGEDPLTVERKFREAIEMKLGTRFVILTNEIPRLEDASGALIGRFIILKLTKSFYGKEDTELTARLLTELPGILKWAIDGWKRLKKNGKFSQPESGKELAEDAERSSSPILAFVADCCEVGSFGIECGVLFDAWKDWAEKQEMKPGTVQRFGRNLRAAVPSITTSQPNKDKGGRVRMYCGIKLLQRGKEDTEKIFTQGEIGHWSEIPP